MTYWILNKPWEAVPVLMKAIRLRRIARRQNDEDHIKWARDLVHG